MSVEVLHGDSLTRLCSLPADSIDCCVTSPPYWGLRDYGFPEQIGLEATPEQWCARLVEVFGEVRRVLKPTGTLWLNCGDAYARTGGSDRTGSSDGFTGRGDAARGNAPVGDLKAKDLIGQPWMLAFALRAAGWYLRSDIVWHKSNPMPESVTDRPTRSHEYIFLLSKEARYFYDNKALAEPSITQDKRRPYGSQGAWELDGRPEHMRPNGKPRKIKMPDGWDTGPGAHGSIHRNGREKGATRVMPPIGGVKAVGENGNATYSGNQPEWSETRNARSVWTIATEPSREKHFAAFPRELARRCIVGGCPAGGVVLDPFAGTGTVGEVALKLGRRAVLIEGNAEYVGIIRGRLGRSVPLFAGQEAVA